MLHDENQNRNRMPEEIPPLAAPGQEQPFAQGTAGSTFFRIPALITTRSGRLVAAADARWNGTGDAGGIDTLVSWSDDNGQTWNGAFANYLGDNRQQFDKNCATFIDPVLTYDPREDVLYLLTDLYAANYAINTADNWPLTGCGFTEQGHLRLKARGESEYSWFVGDFDGDYAGIFRTDGTAAEGYQADRWFYLFKDGKPAGNLFYLDADFQVYPTTYLYLVSSRDGGETWGAPALIQNVKKDSELFYGAAPGRGVVTGTGTLLMPCYVFHWRDAQRSSFLYSDDRGRSWKRAPDATVDFWSSESQLVELDNRTVRMFFRNGSNTICYADAHGDPESGYCWDTPVSTGVENWSDCQLSVIHCSAKWHGREVLLVSCPAGKTGRTNGTVFAFALREDGSMEQIARKEIDSGMYQYSCLTELPDGSIGLLFENGEASIRFLRLNPQALGLSES